MRGIQGIIAILVALFAFSCTKKDDPASQAAFAATPPEDVCSGITSSPAGQIPDKYKGKAAGGAVSDVRDFPSVTIDDNTFAITVLYDEPDFKGPGRCVITLTKDKPMAFLSGMGALYEYTSSYNLGDVSRARSLKLFYLAKDYKVKYWAGSLADRLPHLGGLFTPNHISEDGKTSLTMDEMGELKSLQGVQSSAHLAVFGNGWDGNNNFEKIILKVELISP